MSDRISAIQRVVGAVERRDFSGVSEDDLALADNEHANRLYRQWLADDRYPVPDEDGINCNYDVLVSVSAVSGFGDRHRIVIEHPVRLELEPGDLLYIRRPPRPDPDRHPIR